MLELMSFPGLSVVRRAGLALGALVCLGAAAPALAASTTPAAAAAIASDPAKDAALKSYLQKHFRLASADEIKLAPMVQTPLPGIFSRGVTVTTDRGSATVVMYTDQDESKIIVGQYLDLSKDPWGRISLDGAHLDDRPTLGPAEAAVTLVEFADFECPHCGRAFAILETMANTTYKGKLRVVYKYFPLQGHQWALKAAQAAECARLQNPDTFWEFARHFYANQGSINPDSLQKHIDELAGSLKLDAPSLKACMGGGAATVRIQQDVADGAMLHVGSTPTFIINGIPVVGLPEEKVLDFVVSSELGVPAHASP